ncbi:MAG: hypothetical protein ACFB10_19360 [Salibacteraceae bacterium]
MKKLMFVFAALFLMVATAVQANPAEEVSVIREYSPAEFAEYTYLFEDFETVSTVTLMYTGSSIYLEVTGIDHVGQARATNNTVTSCGECLALCPVNNGGAGQTTPGNGMWGGSGNWCFCCSSEPPAENYALTDVLGHMGWL